MQLVLERGSIDKPLTFDIDTTQFSYQCVHLIHAKVFSIQMLQYFSQIAPRVYTLVLFISLNNIGMLYGS